MLKDIYSVLNDNVLNKSQFRGVFLPISVTDNYVESAKFIIPVDLPLDVDIMLHGQGW
jgi:hypothetical protein